MEKETLQKSTMRMEKDMLLNNNPGLAVFLKEQLPEIQDEFEIDVEIKVRVLPQRPLETVSAEVLRSQLESRLNFRCFKVAEKLRETILNMLIKD